VQQYVRCAICDREFKFITPSHLKTHGYSSLDYFIDFPYASFQSEEFVQERADAVRGYTRDDELKKGQSEYKTGWWKTPEGLAVKPFMRENLDEYWDGPEGELHRQQAAEQASRDHW